MAKRKALEVEEVTPVEGEEEPSPLTFEFGIIITTFLCLLVALVLAWWELKVHYGRGLLG